MGGSPAREGVLARNLGARSGNRREGRGPKARALYGNRRELDQAAFTRISSKISSPWLRSAASWQRIQYGAHGTA